MTMNLFLMSQTIRDSLPIGAIYILPQHHAIILPRSFIRLNQAKLTKEYNINV
jgi:hypothetical protein